LSVMVIAAERWLAAKGVNVTLIVQEPFTAIAVGLSGQLLVAAKSPALVPVTATLAISSGFGPLLVTEIVCAALAVFTVWFGKAMEDGRRVMIDGTGVPVPLMPTDGGLPAPLSVIVIAAERGLAAKGVNVTL